MKSVLDEPKQRDLPVDRGNAKAKIICSEQLKSSNLSNTSSVPRMRDKDMPSKVNRLFQNKLLPGHHETELIGVSL